MKKQFTRMAVSSKLRRAEYDLRICEERLDKFFNSGEGHRRRRRWIRNNDVREDK